MCILGVHSQLREKAMSAWNLLGHVEPLTRMDTLTFQTCALLSGQVAIRIGTPRTGIPNHQSQMG